MLERVTATVKTAAAPWPPEVCPLCGADAVESHVGVIKVPAITPWGRMTTSTHLGRFTVCMRCEWAVEDADR